MPNELKEDRQQKHLDIHQAINDIESLAGRVRGLQEKIIGPTPTAEDGAEKRSEPNLSDILCYGAERIRGINEKIHQMLNEIEQALF